MAQKLTNSIINFLPVMSRLLFTILSATMLFISCSGDKQQILLDELPPMYPDYTDITIPPNIAPLNFLMPDTTEKITVFIDNQEFSSSRSCEVKFSQDDWREFLDQHRGDTLNVVVKASYSTVNVEYQPFTWHVAAEPIDPYLTYRLIEPDYEVFSCVVLEERCVENFETKKFADYERVGNRCMNCHTYGNQNSQLSMFYVRGENGGAVLNRGGELSLLDINLPGMVSSSVYFGFHPSGRYVVFSSNHIIPAFHSAGSKRLEVFDVASDVYVADLVDNTITTIPQLNDSLWLETFPTFSPDGKQIYFCTARMVNLPDELEQLQYYLCRVGFDNGAIDNQVDTLFEAGTSVCHPRVSPDGRFLLYTTQDYGTFPIWHREADLRMIDLQTNDVDSLSCVNSDKSDTYHSWSSNSRWFVFASKRDDGLYGKPYFSYVDSTGNAHKPFVLPQRHPRFYHNCLKSFNAPELGRCALPFDTEDLAELLRSGGRENFSNAR